MQFLCSIVNISWNGVIPYWDWNMNSGSILSPYHERKSSITFKIEVAGLPFVLGFGKLKQKIEIQPWRRKSMKISSREELWWSHLHNVYPRKKSKAAKKKPIWNRMIIRVHVIPIWDHFGLDLWSMFWTKYLNSKI